MVLHHSSIPQEPQAPLIEQEAVLPGAVLNKEQWHTAVSNEIAVAHEMGETADPVTVVFIDVNYFKNINDELGHDEGDTVIEDMRELVTVVSSTLRTKNKDDERRTLDILSFSDMRDVEPLDGEVDEEIIDTAGGHIGGDEFAILAQADEAGGQRIVERLREAIADYLARPDKKRLAEIGVGLAIGTATLKPGMGKSELLREADEAMYQDKLAQIPELDKHQQRVLEVARLMIEQSGIRLRDVPKYWRRDS